MIARRPHVLIGALVVAVLVSMMPASSGLQASYGDALYNGGFEQGFVANSVCGGMVGKGWGCFTNGGAAQYGFYDDMWAPVVYEGQHSQLIEINTKEQGGDGDRNAGIYQTVKVWPHQTYELTLKGMIRAEEGETDDPWRYRVYVGFDYHGGSDWERVKEWQELPWDKYYDRLSPGSFSGYKTQVVPTGERLTVFVRVQRKWGTWYEETDFNLDAISLHGPVAHPDKKDGKPGAGHGWQEPPVAKESPARPPMGQEPPARPPMGQEPPARPSMGQEPPARPPMHPGYEMEKPAEELVCDGPNLLRNGGFEHGFQSNGVARYWMGFNNGGRANYGYYDETWEALVTEGEHGQLIEINTLDVGDATDAERISGIYQGVWLHPGATYELSLDAMMRERVDHSDEDFYRYMVEWGYSKHGSVDPEKIDYQERVPLEEIYLRTEPGEMESYRAQFEAPSERTTIWIYAIKKWATLERELDVNLDNVALRHCRRIKGDHPPYQPLPSHPSYQPPSHPSMQPQQPAYRPPMEPKPAHRTTQGTCELSYTVQRGDSLSALASRHNTSVAAIMAQNGLSNPNLIYVGQRLCIPGSPKGMPYETAAPAMEAARPMMPAPSAMASPAGPSTMVSPAGSNAMPSAMAGQANRTMTPNVYRVQRGDTLSAIALQHSTTVQALIQANGLSNPNTIYAGQSLQIPG